MKKKLLILLMIIASFCLVACNTEVTVKSISVVETSIPEVSVISAQSKLNEIEVKVTKSDGSEEVVNLTKEMLEATDIEKLSTKGTHTLTVTYEGVQTSFTLEVIETYSVQVLYPDNTPVTSGVRVQWCTGENCFLPSKINSEGYAEISLDDGDYYIHIEGIPEGYTYNPNIYTTSASSKHVEIKLMALSSLVGEGTQTSLYQMQVGTYNVTYTESGTTGMKYYSFTPTESGTYSIYSMAMDKLALNKVDPYIGFLGSSIDMSNIDVSGNKDSKIDINFNYTFEATANTTYYFAVLVSEADKFPASFDLSIEKK